MEESRQEANIKEDYRDLNNQHMNFLISESPLKSYIPEDDVTIISSRIDTNKKHLNNTTFDIINSTRKVKYPRDESLRILQTIKKTKALNSSLFKENSDIKDINMKHEIILECEEEYENKQPTNSNFRRHSNAKPTGWKNSLTHLKSSLSERRKSTDTQREECADSVLKTHRPADEHKLKASHRLIEEIKAQAKKRPSSAEVTQGKYKLDVSKMKEKLKLLHRAIKNPNKSNMSPKEINTEPPTPKGDVEIRLPLPSVPEHPAVFSEDKALDKRKISKVSSSYHNMTANNTNQWLMKSPKRLNDCNESPNIPKLRRLFGSESMIRAHSKRNNNELLSESLEHSKMNFEIEPSEHEKSIFDRSTFRDFSYKKFKQNFNSQYNELAQFEKQVHKKGEKEKSKYTLQYKEQKISKKDYNRKIRGVEKWVTSNKKQIKQKQSSYDKNIKKMFKSMKHQQEQLDILKNKLNDPIDCRTGRNNMSSFVVESSLDSIMVDKYDASEYKINKHTRMTPLRNIDNSMHARGGDYLANSNRSIINSAYKNDSRAEISILDKNSNTILETHRTGGDKEKHHLCSIKPFEYKSKANDNSELYKMPEMTSHRSGIVQKEIVFENSKLDVCESKKEEFKHFEDSHVFDDNSFNSGNGLDFGKTQNEEDKIQTRNEKSQEHYVKEMSYESPQKSSADEEWNYKLPTLKSSSGHDNLRNSNSYQTNTKQAENVNDSVSVELLEKSPEMTVFISEKDLSPAKSNSKNRQNLSNRINEMYESNLRNSDDFDNFDQNDTISEKLVEKENRLECNEI